MNLEVGDAALRRIFLRRTASISLEEGRSLEENSRISLEVRGAPLEGEQPHQF